VGYFVWAAGILCRPVYLSGSRGLATRRCSPSMTALYPDFFAARPALESIRLIWWEILRSSADPVEPSMHSATGYGILRIQWTGKHTYLLRRCIELIGRKHGKAKTTRY